MPALGAVMLEPAAPWLDALWPGSSPTGAAPTGSEPALPAAPLDDGLVLPAAGAEGVALGAPVFDELPF